MSYWMYAIKENGEVNPFKGDCGNMALAIFVEDNEHRVDGVVPKVGAHMQVGSTYARTMSAQDYWTTTPVTEILKQWTEDERLHVLFVTRSGSKYLWTGDV